MDVKIEQLPRIRLIMDNEEAVWLMNFIQNYNGDPNDEAPAEANYRETLFNELRMYLT